MNYTGISFVLSKFQNVGLNLNAYINYFATTLCYVVGNIGWFHWQDLMKSFYFAQHFTMVVFLCDIIDINAK